MNFMLKPIINNNIVWNLLFQCFYKSYFMNKYIFEILLLYNFLKII